VSDAERQIHAADQRAKLSRPSDASRTAPGRSPPKYLGGRHVVILQHAPPGSAANAAVIGDGRA